MVKIINNPGIVTDVSTVFSDEHCLRVKINLTIKEVDIAYCSYGDEDDICCSVFVREFADTDSDSELTEIKFHGYSEIFFGRKNRYQVDLVVCK